MRHTGRIYRDQSTANMRRILIIITVFAVRSSNVAELQQLRVKRQSGDAVLAPSSLTYELHRIPSVSTIATLIIWLRNKWSMLNVYTHIYTYIYIRTFVKILPQLSSLRWPDLWPTASRCFQHWKTTFLWHHRRVMWRSKGCYFKARLN